jgi:DNA-binding transcriptional LysR family regulator
MLLDKAKAILASKDDIYTTIGKGPLKLKGHYKIAASPFLMEEYLIPTFIELQKDFPELTADFLSLETGQAVSAVLSGEIDYALVFRSIRHQDLDESILYDGQFRIAVKKKHFILNKGKATTLNDLPAITFRTRVGLNYVENHPIFKKFGISPKHHFFYDNNNTAIKLLLKTDGWALLPDLVLNRNKKSISSFKMPSKWDAPFTVSNVKNKNRSSNLFNILNERLAALF